MATRFTPTHPARMRAVARGMILGALAASGLVGPAAAATLTADYGIWLAGLPFGSAQMTAAVEGEAYKLQLEARLTGLAGVLTSGRGGATASGTLGGARPDAAGFSVLTRSSSARVAITVALAQGNVTKVDIEPPAEPKPDRVPLSEAHKRGVVDPLSALVMPALRRGEPTDKANCDRTIPIFDGWTRFDIILSFAETKTVDQAGYKGPVLVCAVRYVPIAGHRAERPATRFMAENRDISVWLAPVAGTRVLVPLRISVKTTLGTNVIEATKWALDGSVAPAALKLDKPR